MIVDIQIGIGLLALVAAATLLGRRWEVPSSIVLVVAGVGLSFVPGLPEVRLQPDIVLLLVLPPLIYSAGVATSWPDFRANLRAITFLAVGAVLFTTLLVAGVAHWVAAMAWAPALLLGAVISPPDVIAPMAVVGRTPIPRRLATILNGEGLVNDVTALVLVGISTTSVVNGSFSPLSAALTFAGVLVGELAWGYGLGVLTLKLRRWADDVRVEITLSLLTPFAAFWLPHGLGGSGVLAAAIAGLHASWTGPRLIPAATRLQGTFFWNLVVYVLTGFVFLLTGLQARPILSELGQYGPANLLADAAVVCGAAVLARFAWVYAFAYMPWAVPAGGRPASWRQPFLVGFTGIRGVVSLVAAISIPLTVANGAGFPQRDLIVFLTFAVIVSTLVVQGLALPRLIHRLGLDDVGFEEARRDERNEHRALADVEGRALDILDGEAVRLGVGDEVRSDLRHRHEGRRRRAERFSAAPEEARRANELELTLIEAQREVAWRLFADGGITDEARRRIEHELDLEEARIRRDPNEATADGN